MCSGRFCHSMGMDIIYYGGGTRLLLFTRSRLAGVLAVFDIRIPRESFAMVYTICMLGGPTQQATSIADLIHQISLATKCHLRCHIMCDGMSVVECCSRRHLGGLVLLFCSTDYS